MIYIYIYIYISKHLSLNCKFLSLTPTLPQGFDTHHAPLRVCRGVLLEKNVRQTNGVLHELVLDNRSILADYESKPSKDRYGGYTGVWPALSYPVSMFFQAIAIFLVYYCKDFCECL